MCRLLFAVLLLALSAAAQAQSAKTDKHDCPALRPEGLSQEHVGKLVVERLSRALGRDLTSDDLEKTFHQLAGSYHLRLDYMLAARGVGRFLNFDAIQAYRSAADAKGEKREKDPYETLSIREMQELSWKLYASGTAESYAPARETQRYAVHGASVLTPSPAAHWRLSACDDDKVDFLRVDEAENQVSRARVAFVGMPESRTERALLEAVKESLARGLSSNAAIQVFPTRRIERKFPLCADAIVDDTVDGKAIRAFMRSCYVFDRGATGIAIAYTYAGKTPPASLKEDAMRFLNGVLRER